MSQSTYQPVEIMTQAQLTARQAAGTLPIAGTTIRIVSGAGVFVEDKQSTGVSSQPASSGGGGGSGSVPTNWVANTAIDAGKIILATVAVGGFAVGEQIYSTTAITTGATFNASEAARFLSVPEDTTVLKKSDVKNTLTDVDTDKPLSAAQGKALKDTADTLATTVAGKAATAHTHGQSEVTGLPAALGAKQNTLISGTKQNGALGAAGTVIVRYTPNVTVSGVDNNFASDVAAATGGIAIGGLYHTSGAVKVRQS